MRVTDVMAVLIPNTPGTLAQLLEKLAAADVSVEYLYSTLQLAADSMAGIVLRVDDLEKAEGALRNENIRLLTQEDVCRR